MIFRPKSEILTFFPPKIRWSPKKQKKRSSPNLRLILRPISEIQTFEGGCFPIGGLFSILHKKSASKPPKWCDIAYFASQWGGARAPPRPAPGYATAWEENPAEYFQYTQKIFLNRCRQFRRARIVLKWVSYFAYFNHFSKQKKKT